MPSSRISRISLTPLAMGGFKSSEQGFRLVHGLFVFALGRGIGDDSAARLHVGYTILDDHSAQSDARVEIPCEIQV
jgi:hypothetical protein